MRPQVLPKEGRAAYLRCQGHHQRLRCGEHTFTPGCCVFPGFGTTVFKYSSWRGTEQWSTQLACSDTNLIVTWPVFGIAPVAGATPYIDDVATKSAAAPPAALPKKIQDASDILSQRTAPLGIGRNSEKRVCSVDLHGAMSQEMSRMLHTGHEHLWLKPVVTQARHSGPQLRYDGGSPPKKWFASEPRAKLAIS